MCTGKAGTELGVPACGTGLGVALSAGKGLSYTGASAAGTVHPAQVTVASKGGQYPGQPWGKGAQRGLEGHTLITPK